MKKVIILFALSFFTLMTNAQTKKVTNDTHNITNYEKKIDSLLCRIDTLIMFCGENLEAININTSFKNRYKLYQTDNVYNLLLLDTKTGKLEQIQWSLERSNEGCVTINDEDLTLGSGYGSGTFELYPTKNIYQFILLDKTNGRKWHVQWGLESSNRWIRRIW